MSIICQCPAATEIADVPTVTCPVNFGQIQKVAFQRLLKADGTKNAFVGSGTPLAETISKIASWTPLLTAADATKIVVSPYINAPADAGGDARMTSGGNDDLGGVQEVLGGNPVTFSGSLRAMPQEVIAALKTLICEANAGNLGVFLFDENGQIEAIQDQTTPTTYYPIPIRSFFVGDKIHGNYDAKDSNVISWAYLPNYSDNLRIIVPSDFNPLTDLVTS